MQKIFIKTICKHLLSLTLCAGIIVVATNNGYSEALLYNYDEESAQLKILEPQLALLEQFSYMQVTNERLKNLLMQYPNVKKLCIDSDTLQLTEETIQYLHTLPQLTILQLRGAIIINNELLQLLPQGLTTLQLFACCRISLSGLAHLPPNLQKLSLSEFSLTAEGKKALSDAYPSLKLEQVPDDIDTHISVIIDPHVLSAVCS